MLPLLSATLSLSLTRSQVVIEAISALRERNVSCTLPWLAKHLLGRDPKSSSSSKALLSAAYNNLLKALKNGLENGSLVKVRYKILSSNYGNGGV